MLLLTITWLRSGLCIYPFSLRVSPPFLCISLHDSGVWQYYKESQHDSQGGGNPHTTDVDGGEIMGRAVVSRSRCGE